MKIRFNKRKGERILNQLDFIEVLGSEYANSLWFEYTSKKWVAREKWDPKSIHSNNHGYGDPGFPRTFKALIKYLKKHDEIKGCRVKVYTRYVGHFLEVQL